MFDTNNNSIKNLVPGGNCMKNRKHYADLRGTYSCQKK